MKKLIFSLFFTTLVFNANAQEQGKVRVGLDAGIALPNMGAGLNGGLDLRYNFSTKVNAGIKFGGAFMLKDYVNNPGEYSATVCAMKYTLFHGDYYFNRPASSFAPFLGGGAGSFSIMNIHYDAVDQSAAAGITTSPKLGGLLRSGFEAGHFRMALEYYMIPSSTLVDVFNARLGTTGNSFLNLSIGFYLWGGKWRNN